MLPTDRMSETTKRAVGEFKRGVFLYVFQRVFDVVYPMAPDQRRHVSINSARWLPEPGLGLAYGTNKGDLVICRPV